MVFAVSALAGMALLVLEFSAASGAARSTAYLARVNALQEGAAVFFSADGRDDSDGGSRADELAATVSRTPAARGRDQIERDWITEVRRVLASPPTGIVTLGPAPATTAQARQALVQVSGQVIDRLGHQAGHRRWAGLALILVGLGGLVIGLRLRAVEVTPPAAVPGRQPERADPGPAPSAAGPADRHWLALMDSVFKALSTDVQGVASLRHACGLIAQGLDARACGICLDEGVAHSLQLPTLVHSDTLGSEEALTIYRLEGKARSAPFTLPADQTQTQTQTQTEAGAQGQGQGQARGSNSALSVPLTDGHRHYGLFFLVFADRAAAEALGQGIGALLAHHLALALGSSMRLQEGRRVALVEERTAMARELHDSLAQSLAALRMQVSRLQIQALRSAPADDLKATTAEIRVGLDAAYRKLRDLITTFRSHFSPRGLAATLEEALDEYGRHSSVTLSLDYRLAELQLSVNEEFHIMQVVREALSNVVRHSGATRADVLLRELPDGLVEVAIEDDGRGPESPADSLGHHGTTIMRERATSLGGSLAIEAATYGGCRVVMAFRPAQWAGHPAG